MMSPVENVQLPRMNRVKPVVQQSVSLPAQINALFFAQQDIAPLARAVLIMMVMDIFRFLVLIQEKNLDNNCQNHYHLGSRIHQKTISNTGGNNAIQSTE
jgi:hypothetical protein